MSHNGTVAEAEREARDFVSEALAPVAHDLMKAEIAVEGGAETGEMSGG